MGREVTEAGQGIEMAIASVHEDDKATQEVSSTVFVIFTEFVLLRVTSLKVVN